MPSVVCRDYQLMKSQNERRCPATVPLPVPFASMHNFTLL